VCRLLPLAALHFSKNAKVFVSADLTYSKRLKTAMARWCFSTFSSVPMTPTSPSAIAVLIRTPRCTILLKKATLKYAGFCCGATLIRRLGVVSGDHCPGHCNSMNHILSATFLRRALILPF
jgi:hypothetical protein